MRGLLRPDRCNTVRGIVATLHRLLQAVGRALTDTRVYDAEYSVWMRDQ